MRNSKRHSIDKTKCVNTKKTIPFQFFITMKKNLFRKFLALFLTGKISIRQFIFTKYCHLDI